jgi:serine/threonine-protein kinase HipA
MTDTLSVLIGDSLAGTLTRLAGGRLRFDYDEDYRAKREATPLSVSMPTALRAHLDAEIRPWLWGVLPDNQAVLERWARNFHVSASSPFTLLATPVGHDCAGAARFIAPEEIDEIIGRPGTVTWLTDAQLAQRLRELREDTTTWLGREFNGQFSLAGAQAKTALLYEDGRWGVPSGAAATSHILKPSVAGLDDHDLNEHLCLDAAGRAGLAVARTRVARFGEESAIVVERYDRLREDGRLIRIHQEDLAQALGIHPASKYQNEGGPGPGEIARLLRDVMAPRVADEAVWRFFDALAWNWLIAGTDAHAKNYSLLLAGREVRLAPLYDIASALPYGTHERKLRFAMKIGGDYRLHAYGNTWKAASVELGLDESRARDRVLALTERAPDAFAEAADAPGVAALERPLPKLLVECVSKRAEHCKKVLHSASPDVSFSATEKGRKR